ncbi:MAG: hypothetical protein IKO44_00485 [Ruminococcus sp.]|nr:hypothetical protein [Ruminococcus sp.]
MKQLAALFLALVFAFVSGVFAFAEQVPVTCDGQQIDEFAGVPALYVTYPSDRGEYCCAGYVMRFYRQIFGVTVTDINTCGREPTVILPGHEVKLVMTSQPQPFDLAQTKNRTHVAVVKKSLPVGAVVIEQNYKYYDPTGQLVAERDRTVTPDEYYFYRLYIDGRSACDILHPQKSPFEIIFGFFRNLLTFIKNSSILISGNAADRYCPFPEFSV